MQLVAEPKKDQKSGGDETYIFAVMNRAPQDTGLFHRKMTGSRAVAAAHKKQLLAADRDGGEPNLDGQYTHELY